METVTRATTAILIAAFANRQASLDSVRKWIGRVVAADEMDIADEDAAAVAAVINMFEDSSLTPLALASASGSVADVLRREISADDAAIVINLLSRREHLAELFSKAAEGVLSRVALSNALSKTDLPLAVQRRLAKHESQEHASTAAALRSGNVSELVALL